MNMMKVNKDNIRLIHSALTHFVGQPIVDVTSGDELVVFQTSTGYVGYVEHNERGGWSIWMGEDFVYEIEEELYNMINIDKQYDGMIAFYKHLDGVNTNGLQYRSKVFLNIVKTSLANIIINGNLPLSGYVEIGTRGVFCNNEFKLILNLN